MGRDDGSTTRIDRERGHRRLGVPSNLPAELSSFVGRAAHVERGIGLVTRARVLTLAGPGGCGKTRLARRIAAGAAGTFSGGVWWVELAACRDRPQVENALSRAMGLPIAGGTPERRTEVLASFLDDGPTLVVLDNCEHLAGEVAGAVDGLLRAALGLRVLATSREDLGVEGEMVWRVPPLEVPPPAAGPAAMAEYEAVRLFVARAGQARPEFALGPAAAPTVSAICRALDGMPLALELAAARTATLSVGAILEALDDRFRLLTGGPRPAPERLRSLHASVDWSYALCTDEEQALLRRLSVFVGGFEAASATAVAGFPPLDPPTVVAILSELATKSLVQVEADYDIARYRLLETVRVYARARLEEAGEAHVAADRHLAWITELAESLEGATARCEIEALDRVERALPEVRGALARATRSPAAHHGLRLVGALGYFWGRRGYGIEGTDLGEEAVAADATAPAASRARALRAIAYARFYGGCFPTAAETVVRALAEAAATDDRALQARCRVLLGALSIFSDAEQARALLHEALGVAEELGDRWGETEALGLLTFSHHVQHRPEAARRYQDRAARVSAAEHDRFGIVWGHLYTGMAEQVRGAYAASRAAYRTAIREADAIGDPLLALYGQAGLTNLALADGHVDELAEIAEAMNRPEMRFAEATLAFARALHEIADVATDPALAAGALIAGGGVISMYVPFEGPRLVLSGGRHALAHGDVETAEKAAEGALVACRAGDSALAGSCRVLLARVRRRQGDAAGAEQLAHEGLVEIADAGLWADLPDALQVLGGLRLDTGRAAEGARLLAAAEGLDARTGRVDVLAADTAADRDRAPAALGDAFDEVWAAGAALDAPSAVAYARRARGPRGRPRSGWGALSPTELEVVRLVAGGHSNPVIASRLFVTRSTVKTHVAHVFAKLGVTTRTELAAEAVRHGLE